MIYVLFGSRPHLSTAFFCNRSGKPRGQRQALQQRIGHPAWHVSQNRCVRLDVSTYAMTTRTRYIHLPLRHPKQSPMLHPWQIV